MVHKTWHGRKANLDGDKEHISIFFSFLSTINNRSDIEKKNVDYINKTNNTYLKELMKQKLLAIAIIENLKKYFKKIEKFNKDLMSKFSVILIKF